MKFWLPVFLIFISSAAHAQFGLYVQGGGNYSNPRITRTQGAEHATNGYGWQAGAGVEYHFQHDYFTYLGADFVNQNFKKDSTTKGFHSVVSDYNYRPLLINIPFGFGYQFNLSRNVGFKVYAGVTTQIGIAGKVTRNTTYYIKDSTDQPVQVRTDNNTHRINYGRSINVQTEFQSDLANTIWGLNIGAGLNISKAIEICAFYQEGLTNILPGGDGTPEVNKLRSASLSLRFYFPRQYYNSAYKH